MSRSNITIFKDNEFIPAYKAGINELELHELIFGDYIEETYQQSYEAIQKGEYEI